MRKIFATLGAIASLSASPVHAAIFNIQFSGSLYQVTESVASRFQLGDFVYGSIQIDTDAAPESLAASTRIYPHAVMGGFINVSGYSVTLGSGARAIVSDNETYGSAEIDRFIVDDLGASGSAINGLPFSGVFWNWQDNAGRATQAFALPMTQAALDAYGVPTGAIDWLSGDGNNRVTFSLDRVSVQQSAVPEPATWAMMIVGFGFLGFVMRGNGSRTAAALRHLEFSPADGR